MKLRLVLCALLAGCTTTTHPKDPRAQGVGDDAWLVSEQTEVISVVSEEVPANWIHAVPAAEVPAALGLLTSSAVVRLNGNSIAYFPSMPEEMAASGDTIYLLRAHADEDASGKFGAFQKGASIAVVYGHMGSCGPLHRTAVIVRSRTRIDRVYGGCSGTK